MKQIVVLISCLFLFSCQKKKLDDTPIESNWLLPLLKGKLSLNDFSRLEGTNYSYEISADDIGQPSNIAVSSPNITISHIGPFTVPTESIIKYLKIDSLIVDLNINNLFPVNFKAGFNITLRSSNDTSSASNIVFSKTFANDLASNASAKLPLSILNANLNDSLFFFIDQLEIEAFNNVVFNKSIPISIAINKVRLNELGLYPNQSFTMSDTVDFEPGDLSEIYNAGNGALNDSTLSGYMNLFSDNGIPFNTKFQIKFLNGNTLVDSIFENNFVMTGATVNAIGIPTNIVTQKNSVQVKRAKLQHIESSNKIVYSFAINTNGYTSPQVVIQKVNTLALQLVSDIQLIINPFKF